MGSKYSNAQVASPSEMSRGIASAFGDSEEEARKRKEAEDAAQQEAAQGPSAWDTMKSMAGDVAAGAQDMATNPAGVWSELTNMKKKK